LLRQGKARKSPVALAADTVSAAFLFVETINNPRRGI